MSKTTALLIVNLCPGKIVEAIAIKPISIEAPNVVVHFSNKSSSKC